MRIDRLRSAQMLALLVVLGAGLPQRAWGIRVCIQPLEVPFDDDDVRRHSLEQDITTVLESGGFEVVPSAAVRQVIDRVNAEWGGIYDPISGHIVSEKHEIFEKELARGLSDELGCERRLRIRVVELRAPYSAGVAAWDGVKLQVTSGGRALVNVLGGRIEWGWVGALSLWLQLMDLDGETLAFRSAGIEPLVQFSVSRGQDFLPDDRWLRDGARVKSAVRSALGEQGRRLREQASRTAP